MMDYNEGNDEKVIVSTLEQKVKVHNKHFEITTKIPITGGKEYHVDYQVIYTIQKSINGDYTIDENIIVKYNGKGYGK